VTIVQPWRKRGGSNGDAAVSSVIVMFLSCSIVFELERKKQGSHPEG
jgi:hypothetical protein